MFKNCRVALISTIVAAGVLHGGAGVRAAEFDTIGGAKSILENLFLEGIGPAGDLAGALKDSPQIVKGGLILWLNKKAANAVSNEDYDALDKYSTFLNCIANNECKGVRALQHQQREIVSDKLQPKSAQGDFKIYEAFVPKTMKSGGRKGSVTVFWGGSPQFPVTMIYRPRLGSCPKDINCTTPRKTFSTKENPLIFRDSVWCYGMSRSFYFDYEVVLVDAGGSETTAKPAGSLCQPSGK